MSAAPWEFGWSALGTIFVGCAAAASFLGIVLATKAVRSSNETLKLNRYLYLDKLRNDFLESIVQVRIAAWPYNFFDEEDENAFFQKEIRKSTSEFYSKWVSSMFKLEDTALLLFYSLQSFDVEDETTSENAVGYVNFIEWVLWMEFYSMSKNVRFDNYTTAKDLIDESLLKYNVYTLSNESKQELGNFIENEIEKLENEIKKSGPFDGETGTVLSFVLDRLHKGFVYEYEVLLNRLSESANSNWRKRLMSKFTNSRKKLTAKFSSLIRCKTLKEVSDHDLN